MGTALVECVPNFSEGRDPSVLAEIVAAIAAVQGARVLDASSDPDHNRSVATFVAPPETAAAAAFAGIEVATRRIDLCKHRGVHPRIGASDVVPFVPLEGVAMARCVEIAHALGERVARELELPVFFYGEAALRPERRGLPALRRGGFEALREDIVRDPERAPDRGPRAVHPRAGAIAIGARGFLIAFNVHLETRDVAAARAIARAIRESSGGLPGIRALGFLLEEAGVAQVSINVCEPERTGLAAVFEAVERLARERGIEIRESQLVGLAPRFALDEHIARRIRLDDFDPRRHVLEDAVAA